MGETVTLSDFARRKGVSVQAVSKGVKNKRLNASVGHDADGRPKIIDIALADREWVENAKPRGRQHASAGLTAGAKQLVEEAWAEQERPVDGKLVEDEPEQADEELSDAEAADLSPASTISIAEAHRILTIERAAKLRLERQVALGRLVPLAAAKKEAFDSARTIRESVLNIPARIAGDMAAETDIVRVQIMLDKSLREALSATADALE